MVFIYINLLAELNYKRFMFKKLCILLIFSKLKVNKLLIDKYRMHNLYANTIRKRMALEIDGTEDYFYASKLPAI